MSGVEAAQRVIAEALLAERRFWNPDTNLTIEDYLGEALQIAWKALDETLRALSQDDTLANCGCGHGLSEHNGLGCYARLSYDPLVTCDCKETDDRTDLDLVQANLRARLIKEPSA